MSNGFRANPADTNTNTKGKNMTAHARTTGLAILIAAKAIWGLAGEIRTTEVNGISWTYEITSEEEKTARLRRNGGYSTIPNDTTGIVTIPSIIDGYMVTQIGPSAFMSCGITSVEIPDTITTIRNLAFSGCTELSTITIPTSVTNIGMYVFQECNKLSSVNLLSENIVIDSTALDECPNLSCIFVPNETVAANISNALPSITIKTLTRFDESCESFMTRLTPPSTPGGKWQITAFASVAEGDANGLSTGNVRVLCGTSPDALTASIPAHLATATNAVMVHLEFDRPDDAAVQYYKVSFGY